MSKVNMASFNGLAAGNYAPRSAGSINAQRANPHSQACAGNRHSAKYTTALSSGGLSAPPPSGRR